ncbi:hypothetical protein CSQ85_08685 [Bifidobacterium rousetti]|uniref:hypothetical protein n=1 Tax=Bifidobacterium rousetti TaxID=2045439 RepID=UPI001238F5F8|nr:hypothetical protein [Bifidobacterium rousetti]KAA8818558.1 hypothetical protein CSQ85_08685 [Bifidobacterium rousetti]
MSNNSNGTSNDPSKQDQQTTIIQRTPNGGAGNGTATGKAAGADATVPLSPVQSGDNGKSASAQGESSTDQQQTAATPNAFPSRFDAGTTNGNTQGAGNRSGASQPNNPFVGAGVSGGTGANDGTGAATGAFGPGTTGFGPAGANGDRPGAAKFGAGATGAGTGAAGVGTNPSGFPQGAQTPAAFRPAGGPGYGTSGTTVAKLGGKTIAIAAVAALVCSLIGGLAGGFTVNALAGGDRSSSVEYSQMGHMGGGFSGNGQMGQMPGNGSGSNGQSDGNSGNGSGSDDSSDSDGSSSSNSSDTGLTGSSSGDGITA